jgi:hypothetical protein
MSANRFPREKTMTESQAIDRLTELLDRYESMQQAHADVLLTNAVENLERLCFERGHAFANLKNEVPSLLKAIQTPDETTRSRLDKLYQQYDVIKSKDTALLAHLSQRRDDIKQNLSKIAHGKTALKAYGRR